MLSNEECPYVIQGLAVFAIGMVAIMFLGVLRSHQIIYVFAVAIYVLPIFVAAMRQHHQIGPISILTLLLGWTFLGWVIALCWSTSKTETSK